jgi:hypothetical protein
MTEDYKLIPMSEITDEAREISVRWMECEDKHWIGQKHKLASDIMNYAKRYRRDDLMKFFQYLKENGNLYSDALSDGHMFRMVDNFICSITPNQSK